jgi:hypothetical protein
MVQGKEGKVHFRYYDPRTRTGFRWEAESREIDVIRFGNVTDTIKLTSPTILDAKATGNAWMVWFRNQCTAYISSKKLESQSEPGKDEDESPSVYEFEEMEMEI